LDVIEHEFAATGRVQPQLRFLGFGNVAVVLADIGARALVSLPSSVPDVTAPSASLAQPPCAVRTDPGAYASFEPARV